MTTTSFYELARARRSIALETLAMREMNMGLTAGRNRPERLTKAAAQRLMNRIA